VSQSNPFVDGPLLERLAAELALEVRMNFRVVSSLSSHLKDLAVLFRVSIRGPMHHALAHYHGVEQNRQALQASLHYRARAMNESNPVHANANNAELNGLPQADHNAHYTRSQIIRTQSSDVWSGSD
jgi:hypothetical protein